MLRHMQPWYEYLVSNLLHVFISCLTEIGLSHVLLHGQFDDEQTYFICIIYHTRVCVHAHVHTVHTS